MFITKPKWTEKVTVEPMLFLYFVTLAISTLVSTVSLLTDDERISVVLPKRS